MIRAPGERLLAGVLRAERHQARHLLLGQAHFLAAEFGERQILHLEGFPARGLRGGEGMKFFGHGSHAVSFTPWLNAD